MPKSERPFIGGSDIAALLGVDSFGRTALDVYNSILGLSEPEPENFHMRRGKLFEPVAAKQYEKETGNKLRRMNPKTDRLVHPDFPFMTGLEDYRRADNGNTVEIKCPAAAKFSRYKQEGLPQDLIAQALWYLGLRRKIAERQGVKPPDEIEWSLFCAEKVDTKTFPLKAEAYLLSIEQMFDVAQKFWNEHVVPQIPPEREAEPELVFDRLPGELTVINTPEFHEAMELLADARRYLEDGRDLETMAKERIKEAVAQKQGKYTSEAGKVYWNTREGHRTLDKAALIAAQPLNSRKVIEVISEHVPATPRKKVLKEINSCALELDEFQKQGRPFEEFRVYFPRKRQD